eukprot:g205.t1
MDGARRANMFKGLVALLATGLAVKILTFVMNLLLARQVTAESYGAGFFFTLYNSLSLFLQKEGFRRAAMRTAARRGSEAAAGRVALLPLGFEMDEDTLQRAIVAAAAAFETIMCEPFAVAEQLRGRLATRPLAEGTARIVKTAFLAIAVLVLDFSYAYAFSLSEFLYATVAFLAYVDGCQLEEDEPEDESAKTRTESTRVVAAEAFASRLRRWRGNLRYLRVEYSTAFTAVGGVFLRSSAQGTGDGDDTCSAGEVSWKLTRSMLLLALQKLLVAEGEKLLLVWLFPDSATWGTYALGGIGLLALLYGPANAYAATRILYGPQWSDRTDNEAVLSLRCYCVFLFAASLNGIFEAYTHARAPPKWLDANTLYQCALSVCMCGLILLLHRTLEWRAPAIICANAVCMLARVGRCAGFVLAENGKRAVAESLREVKSVVRMWTSCAAFGWIALFSLRANAHASALLQQKLLWMIAAHGGVAVICLGASCITTRGKLRSFARVAKKLFADGREKTD